jgi:hypothetical protein
MCTASHAQAHDENVPTQGTAPHHRSQSTTPCVECHRDPPLKLRACPHRPRLSAPGHDRSWALPPDGNLRSPDPEDLRQPVRPDSDGVPTPSRHTVAGSSRLADVTTAGAGATKRTKAAGVTLTRPGSTPKSDTRGSHAAPECLPSRISVCLTTGVKLRGPEGAQRPRATSASTSELSGALRSRLLAYQLTATIQRY